MTNKAFIPYSINLPTNSEEGSLDGVAKRSTSLGVFDEIPTCNFAPKISVSACYASYANQYLVLQRKVDQMWGVPGGKVKGDESPLGAVLREFLEETGINLKTQKIRFIKTVYISDPDKDFIFSIYAHDFAEKPRIVLRESEHQAYAWKTLEECIKMPLIWGEKEVFERYISD